MDACERMRGGRQAVFFYTFTFARPVLGFTRFYGYIYAYGFLVEWTRYVPILSGKSKMLTKIGQAF